MDPDASLLSPKLNLAFRALEFSLLESLTLEWEHAMRMCKLQADLEDYPFLNPLESLWLKRLKLERDGLPQETAHWRLFGECLLLEHDAHLSTEVPLQERRHARELFAALALSQLGFEESKVLELVQSPQVLVAWKAILSDASSTEAIGQAVDSIRVRMNLHRPYDFARPEFDPIGDQLFQKFLFYRRLQDELDSGDFKTAVGHVLPEVENDDLRDAFHLLHQDLVHQDRNGQKPVPRVSDSEKELWKIANLPSREAGQIVDVLAQIARLQFRRHETKQHVLKSPDLKPKLFIVS